ncbi:hypothetical protein Y09_2310 [Brachybacterium sp. SW0106-09]|nr:hypothetical protein Y09_2310 [Brachybacterium sp. SW0106-09]
MLGRSWPGHVQTEPPHAIVLLGPGVLSAVLRNRPASGHR